MRIDPGPDRILGSCLGDNMKALNAHLPRKRKRLNELLREDHPHVNCGDGSTHTFNKKELEFLAQIVEDDEKELLELPIIIEVGSSGEGCMTVRSQTGIEARLFSQILGMPISCRFDEIVIFKPQVQVLRRVLKTATQYVFCA